MLRAVRTLSLICAIGLLVGCSTRVHPTGSLADGGPGARRSAARPPTHRPAPVAKLTAACPLLPASQLKALLGGGASRTGLAAAEDKPDPSGGYVTYSCEYGANGRHPFAVAVSGIPWAGYTPTTAIADIAKASRVATHRVAGVGAAAVFYTLPDGGCILAAGKRSRGETRTVVFAAPAVVPERKFIEVVRVVLSRI